MPNPMYINYIAQLAGSKWRSRFGRPTKAEKLGEVIQGEYCKMPEDWLQKKIGMNLLFFTFFSHKLKQFNLMEFIL